MFIYSSFPTSIRFRFCLLFTYRRALKLMIFSVKRTNFFYWNDIQSNAPIQKHHRNEIHFHLAKTIIKTFQCRLFPFNIHELKKTSKNKIWKDETHKMQSRTCIRNYVNKKWIGYFGIILNINFYTLL